MKMTEYYIQDKMAELNKRVDDAFMELHIQSTQLNKMNSIKLACNELGQELLRLEEEQKKNLLQTRILTGISAGLWFILLILKFI
jgi:hypothetical protein